MRRLIVALLFLVTLAGYAYPLRPATAAEWVGTSCANMDAATWGILKDHTVDRGYYLDTSAHIRPLFDWGGESIWIGYKHGGWFGGNNDPVFYTVSLFTDVSRTHWLGKVVVQGDPAFPDVYFLIASWTRWLPEKQTWGLYLSADQNGEHWGSHDVCGWQMPRAVVDTWALMVESTQHVGAWR